MNNKATKKEVITELIKLKFSEEKAEILFSKYNERFENGEFESAEDIARKIESDWLDE
jgi:hypothetical protein